MTLTGSRPVEVESARHRPALDGVRALAVAGVVTYHVGALWLPGGFLGVDLFFVLSGFLITGILIDQIDRDGRIAFATFFARRARRLLPALYLLLIVVCAWAAFVAVPAAIGDLRGAALAALFYVANWFFIATGQSYFADMLGPSPLEHTWSLAIEEQYYLLWPLLLLLLVRRVSPRILGVIVIVMIVLSVLLMAVLYDEGDPSVAYFGTFARIHELLVGSLLALAVKRGLALPRALRWTAWIPLALIVAMMATVSDTGAFYYRGGSLIFSLVVAWLLLALGSGAPGGGPTALFSWAPIAWIGLISYGIYLWHWPLILWITPASTGLTGPTLAAVQIAATVTIAAASFYLIERPIRRGRLAGYALTPRRLAVIVPVAMAVISVIIVAGTSRAVAPAADLNAAPAPAGILGETSPDAPVVAIAGDSIPAEIMSDLTREATARGWAVVPMSFGGCSVTGTFQVDDEGKAFTWSRQCSQGFAEIQAETIATQDPDVVLWYSNRERYPVRVDGQVLAAGTPEHRAQLDTDLEETYERLARGGAEVVIVAPVPTGPPVIGSCAPGRPAKEQCDFDDDYYATFADLTEAYAALADRHPDRVRLVRIDDLLCPGSRDCPLVEQQGEAVRPDGVHFSPEGAAWFIPLLFDRAGIEAGPPA